MSEKPNIILINCDDLGYGDLGCYGSEKNNTPYLDRLAAEGKRFTDFYMASPVCSPSRGAMMTGCYPPRIGFGSFDGAGVLFPGHSVGLSTDEKTMAGQLKDVGYATKIIGKWHCGDQPEFLPTRHGFDEYFGIPYSNDMGRQANNNGKNPPLPIMRNETVVQQQPDQRSITERYTTEALGFIEDHKEEPFFLYLAHMYVHVPLFVPQQFLEKSKNGAYGGAVECIDWCMGVLFEALERFGIDDNTLIIFTSDNGSRAREEGGSNEPCRGRKATTWEGGQRVPCIMRWPGKIEAGTVCDAITRSIDFFPTFSSIVGADISDERKIDGVDLSDIVFEDGEASNDTFCYYWGNNLEAVRVGDWKLHVRKAGEEIDELYNLREDVGESDNLYEQHPDIVKSIQEKMEEIREDLGDECLGIEGKGVRPIGRVDEDKAKTLTEYDEDHPYIIAMYDIPDMPTMSG